MLTSQTRTEEKLTIEQCVLRTATV